MSGIIGSPTTEIISEGLVFNVDATKRPCVLRPFHDPLNVYNIVDSAAPTNGCQLPDHSLFVTPSGEVLYRSSTPICSFQFDAYTSGALTSATGGDAGDAGFFITFGTTIIIGYSFVGDCIGFPGTCTTFTGGCGTLLNIGATAPITYIDNISFNTCGGAPLPMTVVTGDAGVCKMSGMTSLDDGGNIAFAYSNGGPTNNNWVRFTDMSTLNLSVNHSAEFVIYNDNVFGPTSPTIYNRGSQSGANGYWWVYLTDGGGTDSLIWEYSYTPSSYTSIGTATVIPRNVYTHGIITIDYENLEYKIYINGVLVNTQSLISTIRNVTSDILYMGVYDESIASNYGFTGNIPILRFYDHVLNQNEVVHNFTAIKDKYGL